MKKLASRKVIPDPVINALLHGRRMWGWGARYGSAWMVDEFLKQGYACVGFNLTEVPEIANAMMEVRMGDIIYLKAFGPSSTSICVMAVGYVTNNLKYEDDDLGVGVRVNWIFDDEIYIPSSMGFDKYRNNRLGTIYQEFCPKIQRYILDVMLNPNRYMPKKKVA